MNTIRLEKKVNGKTEQIKLIISLLCKVGEVHLSDTDLSVLAYYVVYKISDKTDALLISSKVVRDMNALRNIKTKLKRLGFLKRNKDMYKSYELAFSKDFDPTDNEIKLILKIDNT